MVSQLFQDTSRTNNKENVHKCPDEQTDTRKNVSPTQIESFAVRLSSLRSESLGARNYAVRD